MSPEREIGGFIQSPDWPKMGPSMLIASCLILAVRTAKWAPRESGDTTSDRDLEVEVDNALVLANRVFGALLARHPSLFPHTREPWFQPSDEDVPK
jgi:hypothetical protein